LLGKVVRILKIFLLFTILNLLVPSLYSSADSACLNHPSGLTSWWPGDANSNDILNGHDATLQNGVTYDVGKVNQAFSFDGIDDFATVPDNPNLDFTNEITIDAWVKTSRGGVIVDKTQTGDNAHYRFFVFAVVGEPLDGKLGFWNGNNFVTSVNPIPLNEYVHLAMTIQDNNLKFYINGVLDSTHSIGLGAANNGPLRIGVDIFGRGWWVDEMDELEIFDRALSASEIQAIYTAGSNGKCKNLVGYNIAVIDRNYGSEQRGALFLVNPFTNVRTVLSDFGSALQGELGVNPHNVAFDSSGNLLVVDPDAGTNGRGMLFLVNGIDGSRISMADFGDMSQGALGEDPIDVAISPQSQNPFVVDFVAGPAKGKLFSVDSSTGNRLQEIDFGDGNGENLPTPESVFVDNLGNVYVTDTAYTNPLNGARGGIFKVDLFTEERIKLSDFGDNSKGTLGVDPRGGSFDSFGNILITDSNAGTANRGLLFSVDPSNGQRIEVSDMSVPPNIGFFPLDVEYVSPTSILMTAQFAGDNLKGKLFLVDPNSGVRTVLSDFGNVDEGPLATAIWGLDFLEFGSSLDKDSDGIVNDIDPLPDVYSDSFDDRILPRGTTFGTIDDRGDRSWKIQDILAEPQLITDHGVKISVGEGINTGQISSSGSCVPNSTIVVNPSATEILFTCDSNILTVNSGEAELISVINGQTVNTPLTFGTSIKYDLDQGNKIIVTNLSPSPVITFVDGNPVSIVSGNSIQVKTLFEQKNEIINELNNLDVSDKKSKSNLENAIIHLAKSIDTELWMSENMLDTKNGKKVFDEEKYSVKKLLKVNSLDVSDHISKITLIDRTLAQIAINQASAFAGDDKADKEIDKANKEMDKAQEELDKGKPDKAIDHYKKAWEHAQKAIKHAS